MRKSIFSGTKLVETAGVPEPIGTSIMDCDTIDIMALRNNNGYVYIGGTDCTAGTDGTGSIGIRWLS